MTKEELIMKAIWNEVMEGTAWCGWTEKARLGLVSQVQDGVKWAMSEDGDIYLKHLEELKKKVD